MSVYKIRRKSDGLFSLGGSTPRFNKTGKTWKQMNHINAHLSQLYHRSAYMNCELVEYALTEVSSTNVDDIRKQAVERRKKREDTQKKLREEMYKQERYQEFLTLKKEFEH